MENSYSSYADSGDSSPRSREIDSDNHSWDEQQQQQPSNYRVKFMCSYGGKIQPRPHDNQLAYIGGETKILAVDRNSKFSGIISKLIAICDSEVNLKYQLPGEDLDALVSVTNDEDLEHMMIEYDRLHRASPKPARLRLFLFPVKNNSTPSSFAGSDTTTTTKNNTQQWFADALNSVQIQSVEALNSNSNSNSSPPAVETPTTMNPDFLFGLEKNPVKLEDLKTDLKTEVISQEVSLPATVEFQIGQIGSELVREDVVSPAEIQRQIHELQRLQISNQEQQIMYQRKNSEENLTRAAYPPPPGEYYVQKIPENTAPVQMNLPAQQTVTVPANYWQQQGSAVAGGGTEQQPVYYIQTPTGYYQAPPPPQQQQVVRQQQQQQVTTGQGYYTMQRVQPEVYRESPVYSVAPPQAQPRMMTGYGDGVGVGMVRPQTGGGIAEGGGYAQVAYDSAGRQVYYTAAPIGGGVMGGASSNYQTMSAVAGGMDLRQQQQIGVGGGGPLMVNHQEGKVPKPSPPQASV